MIAFLMVGNKGLATETVRSSSQVLVSQRVAVGQQNVPGSQCGGNSTWEIVVDVEAKGIAETQPES